MAKTWKDNPNKWKRNKDFQKKQKQKHPHMPLKQRDPYPNDGYLDVEPAFEMSPDSSP